ncbi:hypothetical protein NLG97_g7015 [Lecanicillium saksenae]|uniref:Uncharacterized protein n=1 Tax=Lecanicillium saksenae TaxID=468837 RepID=A0ACC1QPL0_9HYPO|nr:hypothetical protein NLG97_g7015 [Lecanicillium saksenae]
MSEGIAVFSVPGLAEPCETWYRTVGEVNSSATPLVILHGGPGVCHDYLLPLTDLSVPLIFYDQIGNGRSTHLPEKNGDEAFWTVELFKAELDNLMRHLGLQDRPVDVYGHSWGGILAAEWAVGASSSNLRRLILASSLASQELWAVGTTALRNKMPEAERAAFDKADETGDYESPEYLAAMEVFSKRHLSLARPWPAPEVQAALNCLAADPTTHITMLGRNQLVATGSLKDWTIVSRLHKIAVPTLLIHGSEDMAQDVAMQPFFDLIHQVEWVKLDHAAHLSHVDKREKHMQVIDAFLAKK